MSPRLSHTTGGPVNLTDHLVAAHNAAMDGFDRADSAVAIGEADTRALSWTVVTGGGSGGAWGISGGAAYKPSAGYGLALLDLDTDGVAEVTISDTGAATSAFWLISRYSASALTYVRFGADIGTYGNEYIFTDSAGGEIAGGITTFAPVDGDRLRIITRRNDGLAAEVTRAGVTTRLYETGTVFGMDGEHVRHGLGASGTDVRFDDFSFVEL